MDEVSLLESVKASSEELKNRKLDKLLRTKIIVDALAQDLEAKSVIFAAKRLPESALRTLLEIVDKDFINTAMIGAAEFKRLNNVLLLLKHGAIAYNEAMVKAALKGSMEIVTLMVKMGAIDFVRTMYAAAEGGHLEILKFAYEKFLQNKKVFKPREDLTAEQIKVLRSAEIKYPDEDVIFGKVFDIAVKHGHEDIVTFLISKMPKEYHWKSTDSIKESIKRGHGELVKKLSSSLYSVDIAAEAAAGIGDFELVKYFIGSGAKNFSRIMLEAGRSGSIDIINYLLDLKKSDFEALLEGASVGGHPKIVDFALKNGAKDVQGALAKAVSGGNKEVVKLLLSWGATLTPKIIRLIVKLGNDELLDLLDFKNIDANDLLSETISDKMIQYLEERLEQELNLAREERNIEKLENLRYYEQSLGINSIVSAISNKNIELLIRLANRWKNWDYILYEAAKKGDLDIVKLAVENGADEFKDTLLLLARSGNIFLFKYLFDIYHEMIRRGIIQRGFYVREFHESLFVKAGKGGNVDIMTMILRGYRFKIDSEMLRKILRHRHYDAINLALSVKMYD